jgi:two-component system, cell cycle sensor histidine kinase and response regulator CckA
LPGDPRDAVDYDTLLHALGERVKELRAFRRAASILLKDDPPQEVLQRIARILPPAMQYPAAAARVAYGSHEAATPGFRPSPWALSSHFITTDGRRGDVQVVYLEERWPAGSAAFADEEGHLLEALADMMRLHFERRLSDEARKATESLLQTASRIARFGAWRVDMPNLSLTWSPEVSAIHDLPPGTSATVEQTIQFYAPMYRDMVRRAVDHCLRLGTPFDFEAELVTATGRRVWVRAVGEAIRSPDGAAVSIQGALQDISRRKAGEAETRRLTQRLETTLETITDALVTLNTDWCFTYLNREAERQFGRPRETLIGRHIWTEFPEAVGTVFEIQARKAVSLRQTLEFEEFFPPRRAWFSVRIYPSEQGLTAYFQNVTRQRQAREEARTSEERFRLLARATSDAIWDWDIIGGTLWWNEGFEALFGYRREEIEPTTRSWTSRVHPDERRAVIQGLERALAEGAEAWSAEYRFRRSDGTYAVVLDRGHIIRDPQGTPVRMIGGISDQSERRRLEAQFLRAQRLESIGTLAGGIAHDLNNVLTPIVMSVALLKEDEADPGRLEMLNSIEASAQRGAAMVRQVLAFARGVSGQTAPVNPVDLVRDVQKIIRDTFPKDIELKVHAAPGAWAVQADATQVHQVLMNLCLNARDAMPAGGSLTLSVQNVVLGDDAPPMAAAFEPGPCVRLSVADTGTGMSREVQDRMFEPFFTTKEVGKGTGLGLSTALTIVKSHGGFIDVRSEPGQGTGVNVYLPVKEPAAPSTPEPCTPARGIGGDGELILVVDDEEGIRSTTRRMLERFGYRVLVASNGAEAVALYVQHQPDVAAVITDMVMPVMDGPAMIFALEAIDPDVRIIASSGHTVGEGVTRALDAGVQHFIPKPYRADDMLAALQELLGKAGG